jgi:hypothetical protein
MGSGGIYLFVGQSNQGNAFRVQPMNDFSSHPTKPIDYLVCWVGVDHFACHLTVVLLDKLLLWVFRCQWMVSWCFLTGWFDRPVCRLLDHFATRCCLHGLVCGWFICFWWVLVFVGQSNQGNAFECNQWMVSQAIQRSQLIIWLVGLVSTTLLVAWLLFFWINCFCGCFGTDEWSPDAFWLAGLIDQSVVC